MKSLQTYLLEATQNKYVVFIGTGYQTLWSKSGPSETYKSFEEFPTEKLALAARAKLVKSTKSKTHVGQGGIPSGYDYPIFDIWEISSDYVIDINTLNSPHKVKSVGGKKLELVGNKSSDTVEKNKIYV